MDHVTSAIERVHRILRGSRRHAESQQFLVCIGSLAAAAAHEMRVPLCTVAILTEELLRKPLDPALRQDLSVISAQVQACQRLLSELLEVGAARGDVPPPVPADVFIDAVIARWCKLRPGIAPVRNFSGTLPAPRMRIDHGLEHALLNLLNNAADASPGEVQIACLWNAESLEIRILDRGPGIPEQFRSVLGERVCKSTQGQGAGIGVLLARTLIAKARGQLQFLERPGGGTLARVVLPVEIDSRKLTLLRQLQRLPQIFGGGALRKRHPAN